MQIDIKTTAVEPVRNNFDNVRRRQGSDKPVSRYLEATLDVQSEEHFHYRPLWDQRHAIHDPSRTRIRMKDWYALLDPRQYYYGTYTIARARMQDAVDRNFKLAEKRGLFADLPPETARKIRTLLLPRRHVEWGANMNNCLIADLGYGTAVTQAAMFATMDRLGIAQYLTRLGLLLDGNTGDSLDEAKRAWMEHEAWQGLRRYVEDTFVLDDWFELHVAQNLVLDGVLYPLYERFEDDLVGRGASALPVVLEFMPSWTEEHRRWTDAVVQIAARESEDNRKLLADWASAWRKRAAEAVGPLQRAMFEASTGAKEQLASLDVRIGKLCGAVQ